MSSEGAHNLHKDCDGKGGNRVNNEVHGSSQRIVDVRMQSTGQQKFAHQNLRGRQTGV